LLKECEKKPASIEQCNFVSVCSVIAKRKEKRESFGTGNGRPQRGHREQEWQA
jgi:hypothetical protein